MILKLDLQSPYDPDGSPRQDLPTGEVLAWDGKEWANGFLTTWGIDPDGVILMSKEERKLILNNVKRFAPLPTIYEDDNSIL